MWRQGVILLMTIASCAAIPKAGSKRELQRLVRLPQIDFPSPINFDRVAGFSVFPLSGSATAEVAQLLREAKGVPDDAPLLLEAAGIFASGGDVANSIRSYARAADLFGRKIQSDPGNAPALRGVASALMALGRFGEAQAALEKAASAEPAAAQLELAWASFHQEKAWTAFAGEENRFSNSNFLQILEMLVRRGEGTHIEAAVREIQTAAGHLERARVKLGDDPDFLRARACFRSFRSALETAFTQLQDGATSARELRKSLFSLSAIHDLQRAAQEDEADPGLIASAIFAGAVAEANTEDPFGIWAQLNREGQEQVSALCRRLVVVADSGSKAAPRAAEYLGCVQVYLMKDFWGAERNFRTALRVEPFRERSWELLIYSIFSGGDFGRLVGACEERSSVLPNARSSALLIRSYDRQGDALRAEWAALSAATAYPQDFQINLSLAALLLKRDEVSAVLWRAGDALNRAEKLLGPAPARDAHLTFVLLKSIYLALADQPEQAKALLNPYIVPGKTRPEVQEILQALDS